MMDLPDEQIFQTLVKKFIHEQVPLAINDIEIIDPRRWPQSLIHRTQKQSAEAVGGA